MKLEDLVNETHRNWRHALQESTQPYAGCYVPVGPAVETEAEALRFVAPPPSAMVAGLQLAFSVN